jgi:hypothetical protein
LTFLLPPLSGLEFARTRFAVSSEPQTHGPSSEESHMGDTTNELKTELKKSLSDLQRLRDEVRVRLHLASMELKDQWNKLEPYLADVEQKASEATEASRTLLSEAKKRLEQFRASLH